MHPLPGSLAGGPPVGDQDTLERLLDGPIDLVGPPGYGGLARLLAAAAAPAAAQGLPVNSEPLASSRRCCGRPRPAPPEDRCGRQACLIKAAAAALVAVLSVGGIAAAATGHLPGQASPVADQPAATTAADAAAGGPAGAAAAGHRAPAGANRAQGRDRRSRAGATAAARAGLCQGLAGRPG